MILVTGAGGFVGSRVIARLVTEDERPRGLVRDLVAAHRRLPEAVELVQGDTTRPETLEAALDGVRTVIHCAFVTADRKQGPGVNYYQTNVVGTRNLVAAAQRAGVECIVELGGLGTKPAGPGSYMQGRFEADEAIRGSGLAWSILGPSIQFGAGAPFFVGLTNLIRSMPGVVPMVGNGSRRFQPIWVEDVVTCVLRMAREPERYAGRVIEVGGPEIYTYSQILDLLMRSLGTSRVKVPGPVPLVKLGAALMSAVLAKPPITPAATELFSFENVTALDAVQREFGFTPRSLPDYLAEEQQPR